MNILHISSRHVYVKFNKIHKTHKLGKTLNMLMLLINYDGRNSLLFVIATTQLIFFNSSFCLLMKRI